jgi:hypothetical protein
MCSQNCRKCYFRDPNFKNFLGACPQIPLANSYLRYSAIAYYPGRRARKMGKENGCFAQPLKNP